MNATKVITYTVLAILGVFLAWFIVKKIVVMLLGLLIPILIVGGIGVVLYLMLGRKALGHSRRRFLP